MTTAHCNESLPPKRCPWLYLFHTASGWLHLLHAASATLARSGDRPGVDAGFRRPQPRLDPRFTRILDAGLQPQMMRPLRLEPGRFFLGLLAASLPGFAC